MGKSGKMSEVYPQTLNKIRGACGLYLRVSTEMQAITKNLLENKEVERAFLGG